MDLKVHSRPLAIETLEPVNSLKRDERIYKFRQYTPCYCLWRVPTDSVTLLSPSLGAVALWAPFVYRSTVVNRIIETKVGRGGKYFVEVWWR